MQIFVSYDFADKAHFENITDALEDAGLDYWKTGETRSGEQLAKQLQDAISRAALCIFIATRNSVSSSWCGAELGAFWGTKKRVLIFLADESLAETDLPRQFQGHFLQRRIKSIVKDCKQYLEELAAEQDAANASSANTGLGNVSREDLTSLIEDAIFRATSNSLAIATFSELEAHEPPSGHGELSDDHLKRIKNTLHSFLGLTRSSVDGAAPVRWPHPISVETSTGHWRGYAKKADWQSYNYVHTPCLFFKYDEKFRVIAVVLCRWYVEFDKGGEAVQGVIASAGNAELGEVKQSP
jgi:hypothetical protein